MTELEQVLAAVKEWCADLCVQARPKAKDYNFCWRDCPLLPWRDGKVPKEGPAPHVDT